MAEALLVPGRQLDPSQYADFGSFAMRHVGADDPEQLQEQIIASAIDRMLPEYQLAEIIDASTLSQAAITGLTEEINEDTELQARHWVQQAERLDPDRLLPAVGYTIMVAAHEGQTRKAGGPYARHPERVAARGHDILNTLRGSDHPDINRHFIDAADFVHLGHDVIEDQERRRLTSLMVSYIFEHEDIENPHGDEAAHTLDLMTDVRSPWTPRSLYIARLAEDPGGRVGKPLDITDNLDQRKPVRTVSQWKKRRVTETGYKRGLVVIQGRSSVAENARDWEPEYQQRVVADRAHRLRSSVMGERVAHLQRSVFGHEVSVEEIGELLAESDADHGVPDHLVA